jgi:hypothetical protein
MHLLGDAVFEQQPDGSPEEGAKRAEAESERGE